jgi:hypothetical protein
MKKSLKTISYLASVAVLASLWGGPAAAWSAGNAQLQSSGLMEKFSVSDVASMLKEFEIEIALQPYENDGSATLAATTAGGGLFIISMFQCDDATIGAGCKQALVYTGMSNAGLSYEDLNTFHTNSDVTRAVNVPEQQMVVFGTQIYAQGGIGRQNFLLLTALFLNDMQNYVDAQSTASTSVALKILPSTSKSENLTTVKTGAIAAPKPNGNMYEHALTAALSNTWNVKFLTEEAAKLVD